MVKSALSLKLASVSDDGGIPFFIAAPPDFNFHTYSGAVFVLLVVHVCAGSPGNFVSTFARVPLSSYRVFLVCGGSIGIGAV